MYTIEYYYLDKRGHTRSKRIECCNLDRVRYHCYNISKLTEHKPIAKPIVTYLQDGLVVKRYNYDEFIKKG